MGTEGEVKKYDSKAALSDGDIKTGMKMTVLYGMATKDPISSLSFLHVMVETEDRLDAAQTAMKIAQDHQVEFPEMFIGEPHVHFGHVEHFQVEPYEIVIFIIKENTVVREIARSVQRPNIDEAVLRMNEIGSDLVRDLKVDSFMVV